MTGFQSGGVGYEIFLTNWKIPAHYRKAKASDVRRWINVERPPLRKLEQIDWSSVLDDLRVPPTNHLETLKGSRKGQHSSRVNDQWRVCFVWTSEGAQDVEIVDYH